MSSVTTKGGLSKSMLAVVLVLAAVVFVVYFTPSLRERLRATLCAALGCEPASPKEDEHSDSHHKENSLTLSPQAQANIGLQLGKVELGDFNRTIAIPGILRERPGRSMVAITAPLTGTVTQIFPILGETVLPGQKLFELRLTHEELVQAQGDFLRVAEELDVIEREIKRLEKIAVDGGIAGRQVLERQYERQNKQAVLRAQRQALLLHGLSEAQVESILEKRELLRSLTVVVPAEQETAATSQPTPAASTNPEPKKMVGYEIRELKIERGQSVSAGETMAILTDHATLFIEGSTFDKDMQAVNRTIKNGWNVEAVIETDDAPPQVIKDLPILHASGSVDPETRTFHFYVPLANPLLREVTSPEGNRFVTWQYKPGQRVQLLVPVEKWLKQIVLPVDAVAQHGVETYVFTPNGNSFDRRPVHVEYRDRFSVVIADDGSVFPGDSVVLKGAQQMQLALKNQSGGPVDPHAGHNH
jgi:cobalt-zinc-cadmium efflux system membrane fusion protein